MLEIFLIYTRQLNHRIVVEDRNPTKYKLMPSKYNANQIRITLIDEDSKILDFLENDLRLLLQ